jgi:uncharacterized protein YdhG (YjbR/CyaY superfamily)
MIKVKAKTIEEYIQNAPELAQPRLRQLHGILKGVVPGATETIKWGYPVFEGKRILFSFSAHKAHINFMPTSSSLHPFLKELEEWTIGKDTIQLPYDKPLPEKLIGKIATHRFKDVEEHDARWMGK